MELINEINHLKGSVLQGPIGNIGFQGPIGVQGSIGVQESINERDIVLKFKELTHLKLSSVLNGEIQMFIDKLINITHLVFVPYGNSARYHIVGVSSLINLEFLKIHELAVYFGSLSSGKLREFHYHSQIRAVPSSITHLKFIDDFHQFDYPLSNTLVSLDLKNTRYSHDLPILPQSLRILLLPQSFNKKFDMPSKLIHLELGNEYDQVIDYLPNSLKYIIIPQKYKSLIPFFVHFVKLL